MISKIRVALILVTVFVCPLWLMGQQTTPPPEALYLGMCVERKANDRAAESLYVVQLRNRYPDSAEAKAITTGLCE